MFNISRKVLTLAALAVTVGTMTAIPSNAAAMSFGGHGMGHSAFSGRSLGNVGHGMQGGAFHSAGVGRSAAMGRSAMGRSGTGIASRGHGTSTKMAGHGSKPVHGSKPGKPASNADAGKRPTKDPQVGNRNPGNDKPVRNQVSDTPAAAKGDRGSENRAVEREARAHQHEGHGRPGDVAVPDGDSLVLDLVRRLGHDAVIDGPNNTYLHVWRGNHGEPYVVYRDNNKGLVSTFVVKDGTLTPVLPKVQPKRESFIKLYDPDTNTTTTRMWPTNRGRAVRTVEEGKHL